MSIESSHNIQYEYDYSIHPINFLKTSFRSNNSYFYLSNFSLYNIDSKSQLHNNYPSQRTNNNISRPLNRYFSDWNYNQTDKAHSSQILSSDDLEIKLRMIKERMYKKKPQIDLNADVISFSISEKKKKIDIKCIYCNRNHILAKCREYSKIKQSCGSCYGSCHTMNECLKFPFSNNSLDTNSNMECLRCGCDGHLYCPSSISKKKKNGLMKLQEINLSNQIDDSDNESPDDNSDDNAKDEININDFDDQYIVYKPQPSSLLLNKNFYDEDDDISI